MSQPTMKDIFDLFYSKQNVVRSGGGKIKSKMRRNSPSLDKIISMEFMVKNDKRLHRYFVRQRDRKANIAPPPAPKSNR